MSDVRGKSKNELNQASKSEFNRKRNDYNRPHNKGLSYRQYIQLSTYQENRGSPKPQEFPKTDGRGKNFNRASRSATNPERKDASLPRRDLTYKEVLLLQTSQKNGCPSTEPQELPKTDLVQSGESLKQHRTGWDDEIFSPPQPMEEDETSRRFLKNIQQIRGKTIDDIVALIPKDATGKDLTATMLGLQRQGFLYSWQSPQGNWWTVYAHSPECNVFLPKDSNSLNGWIVRVRRDNEYMDSSGNFHPAEKAQPRKGDISIINDTHIPIQTPDPYVCPLIYPERYEQTEWGREQLQRIANLLNRGQIQS
jgi:hypothetical protein